MDGVAIAGIWEHVGQDLAKVEAVFVRYLACTVEYFAGHRLTKLNADLARFLIDTPQVDEAGQPWPPPLRDLTDEERIAGGGCPAWMRRTTKVELDRRKAMVEAAWAKGEPITFEELEATTPAEAFTDGNGPAVRRETVTVIPVLSS